MIIFVAEREGYKEVCCHKCQKVIGWLSNEDIAIALDLTCRRGGVLCPKCRKRICPVCWLFHESEREEENCEWMKKENGKDGGVLGASEEEYCLSSSTYLHKVNLLNGMFIPILKVKLEKEKIGEEDV